jgi:hypothetical protein
MINKYITNIYNFINYFTLACVVPIGYFAPLGEWILISFLALTTLIITLVNKKKINYENFYLFLILIIIVCISFYWSINPFRTQEVIGPISCIILAIFIVLNISSTYMVNQLENVIGIPIIIISICILLDLVFNTEIRSSLAILAGDKPTSLAGNYGRGIVILTMIMPLSIACYLSKKKILPAVVIIFLVTLTIILGPNDSAKLALFSAFTASLIIYFLGPRSFLYFGIISLIFVLFLPIFSSKILPNLSQIKVIIDITEPCTENSLESTYWKKIPETNNCIWNREWQETSIGGSIIHRFLVWEFVGNEIYNRPFLGHGAGTARLIGQNIILNIPNTKDEIKGGIPLHPHNNFLEIWLELGLIGIITISIIWIKIILLGFKIRKKSYIIGTGVCSSIITIFVISNLSFGVSQAWWMASIGLIFLLIINMIKNYTNE